MQDIYLPSVHVRQQLLQMFGINIFQINYGMFVWSGVEESPEIRTADRQDQLVSLKNLSPAGESHVTQLLSPAQVLHYCKEARVVVIPL